MRLTHPDRVVYADQGLTKAELARYYVRVEDWIMPRLAGRPLTLVRCPEGQPGQCFFQKHADASMPDSIKRVTIDEEDGRSVDIYIEELEGLVWLVQMGVLELHTWGSHVQTLERPDELVFDLDPDEGLPWDRVVEAARLLRRRFGALGLTSFVKTSGGKGLHVVVPIEPVDDWGYVKSFCTAFAQSLVEDHPDRYVATMSKRRRVGKVFVDYLRNGRGATSVAAYSTRSRAGAPVSLPIRWEELGRSTGGAQYDVARTLSRLAHLREDPWQGIEEARRGQRLPHPDAT